MLMHSDLGRTEYCNVYSMHGKAQSHWKGSFNGVITAYIYLRIRDALMREVLGIYVHSSTWFNGLCRKSLDLD